MDELREVLIDAAILVFPVLASIFVYYARVYLRTLKEKLELEIGSSRLYILESFIETFVRAAEQTAGLEGDQAKKDYVFERLRETADNVGFQISNEQLEALIEGVYNRVKNDLKGPAPVG